MAPEDLPIGIQRRQDALGALHENLSGFWINGGARSGVTLINRVAEEIIVKPLPIFLAGFRVEAGNSFLQVRTFSEISHDIYLAVGNDGSGLTGEIGNPERLLDVEFIREIFLQRAAVLLRAT